VRNVEVTLLEEEEFPPVDDWKTLEILVMSCQNIVEIFLERNYLRVKTFVLRKVPRNSVVPGMTCASSYFASMVRGILHTRTFMADGSILPSSSQWKIFKVTPLLPLQDLGKYLDTVLIV